MHPIWPKSNSGGRGRSPQTLFDTPPGRAYKPARKFNNQPNITMAIAVGTQAPDFSLKSKSPADADVKLSNNFGKKNTVVLFSPLAFTGVCTTEMCDVTAGLGAYQQLNA